MICTNIHFSWNIQETTLPPFYFFKDNTTLHVITKTLGMILNPFNKCCGRCECCLSPPTCTAIIHSLSLPAAALWPAELDPPGGTNLLDQWSRVPGHSGKLISLRSPWMKIIIMIILGNHSAGLRSNTQRSNSWINTFFVSFPDSSHFSNSSLSLLGFVS